MKEQLERGKVYVLTDKDTGTAAYWLCCPECGGMGVLDPHMYHGEISVKCDCGYHETKDWSKGD